MITVSLENVINWLHITPSYQDVYQDIKTQRLTWLVVNVYKSRYSFVIDICTYATSKRGTNAFSKSKALFRQKISEIWQIFHTAEV
jgi:hypothetical protein